MRNALLHVVSAVSAVSAVMQGCSTNAYCARAVDDRASVSTTPPGNRKDLSAIRSVKKKLGGKLKRRFDQDELALKKLLCKPQSESVLASLFLTSAQLKERAENDIKRATQDAMLVAAANRLFSESSEHSKSVEQALKLKQTTKMTNAEIEDKTGIGPMGNHRAQQRADQGKPVVGLNGRPSFKFPQQVLDAIEAQAQKNVEQKTGYTIATFTDTVRKAWPVVTAKSSIPYPARNTIVKELKARYPTDIKTNQVTTKDRNEADCNLLNAVSWATSLNSMMGQHKEFSSWQVSNIDSTSTETDGSKTNSKKVSVFVTQQRAETARAGRQSICKPPAIVSEGGTQRDATVVSRSVQLYNLGNASGKLPLQILIWKENALKAAMTRGITRVQVICHVYKLTACVTIQYSYLKYNTTYRYITTFYSNPCPQLCENKSLYIIIKGKGDPTVGRDTDLYSQILTTGILTFITNADLFLLKFMGA